MQAEQFRHLIAIGQKCKLHSKGTEDEKDAAYTQAAAILIFLILHPENQSIEFLYGKDKRIESNFFDEYFHVLMAEFEEEVLGIALPRISASVVEVFMKRKREVKRPKKSRVPKLPYKDFSDELTDFDLSYARSLVLPNGAERSLWLPGG